MVDNFIFKEKYNCEDLLEIVKILRAPGGCPWDAEQTHESIKKNLIEETYEVIEAINKQDKDLLSEELGDLLLQIALHTEMEKEANTFDFDDVCNGISQKLIIRHPHVFGDVKADTTDEVLTNWEAIKRQTKQLKTTTESMLSVPRELPALMRSTKIQSKASKVGFDWDNIDGALEKVDEEVKEVRDALKNGSKEDVSEELGDLLFAVVNVTRFADVDAEEALTAATDKFLNRFSLVEKKAQEKGIDMKASSIEELDRLWDEAKKEMK